TSNTLASDKILSKLDEEQKIKLKLVRESVEEFDIEKLREHCLTKGGLVHNSIRRAAWQILLKNSFNHKRKPKVSKHKDESQVGLDAKRSFNSFPKNLSSEKRVIKQTELNSLIKNVLRREPRLNYYQGFHDIASVLLLILDSKTAVGCLQNLSIYFLRDYLGSTLAPVIRQIGLVLSLIRAKDPELSRFLNENQVQPYFCLSWLLTWCSHDIPDLTDLARLFDVLLVSNPSLIIYFVCAVNLNRREEILQLDDDPALIHTYLKQFPEKYDLEDLIQKSLDLYNEYP
ncbi:RabGAP/TBC, partial [Conidiobolus coronatus NRRL 28638]